MEDLDKHYKKVIESLKLLSLPYEEQKHYFPDFVDIPYEILDTFDNAFLLLPKLIENDLFSNNGIAWLIRLHNTINLLASNPDFKDLEENQFRDNEEWNKIRGFSKEVLRHINEPIENPDPKYI
jgi:hypothetical protein